MTSIMLVSMTFLSNILCCAILGAYATIYPMDYYLGSNLKYIIINTIRRATVPQFNKAVLSPPFEWRGEGFFYYIFPNSITSSKGVFIIRGRLCTNFMDK